MIDLDIKEISELEDDLKKFNKRAFPFATKAALNSTAFDARREAQVIVKRRMVTRNKWTLGSIRVQQTRTLNVRQQAAVVGSTEKYMETQEFGGTRRARGSRGVAIPTGYSAGQEGRRPRTRVPRAPNRLRRIQLAKFRSRARTPMQRMVVAVNLAVARKKRLIFLEVSGGKRKQGIFRVLGGRATKRGWPKGAKLKMVHDLSQRRVRTPQTRWLDPAVTNVLPGMQGHYRRALIFQLDRAGMFRGS